MSNKKELVKENLKELTTRIGLLVKQYNLLSESEELFERLILVSATEPDTDAPEKSDKPTDLYDLVLSYNDSRGWSSSESCY